MKHVFLLLVLALPACAFPGATIDPPVVPLIVPGPETTVFLSSPVECVDVVQLAALVETPTAVAKPLPKKVLLAAKPLTPQQVVATAQQQARVSPDARGYFGGSAEYTYTWQPGKVYVVLLSAKSATVIILPPGERTVAAMYVDKDAYEVTTTRAGREGTAYDTITIRPTAETGEVDSFILTESGRRYLFHFITGATGMIAVAFETPHLADGPAAGAALILPKPQP